tara:strand:- start:28990 stop:30480 length:1491 start_codon:yes stop_codon:yes gene_type:complete
MILDTHNWFRHVAQSPEAAAFALRDDIFTYRELGDRVAHIRSIIRRAKRGPRNVIAVVAHEDLNTYASLLAVMAERCAYVPLDPTAPWSRNEALLKRAGAVMVLSSKAPESGEPSSSVVHFETAGVPDEHAVYTAPTCHPADIAYILFTSGSTGEPKGVPITHANLLAFLEAFFATGCDIRPSDRVLQMFALTFDLSVVCYLATFISGACLCPVPSSGIRAVNVIKVLQDKDINVALFVPSALALMRNYFDELQFPSLRHSMFCGEALPADLVASWAACTPNATQFNFYGPTEATIYCTYHQWQGPQSEKSVNGILAIGKPMQGMEVLVVDENDKPLEKNITGQLCLYGPQVTHGYWNSPEITAAAFFEIELHGETKRFYRTGDLASVDDDGDLLYFGRVDHQVKIQGYRVELGEIEFFARKVTGDSAAAVVVPSRGGLALHLFAVTEMTSAEVLKNLKELLPAHMVPKRVHTVSELPLNASGKIDRPALAAQLQG